MQKAAQSRLQSFYRRHANSRQHGDARFPPLNQSFSRASLPEPARALCLDPLAIDWTCLRSEPSSVPHHLALPLNKLSLQTFRPSLQSFTNRDLRPNPGKAFLAGSPQISPIFSSFNSSSSQSILREAGLLIFLKAAAPPIPRYHRLPKQKATATARLHRKPSAHRAFATLSRRLKYCWNSSCSTTSFPFSTRIFDVTDSGFD